MDHKRVPNEHRQFKQDDQQQDRCFDFEEDWAPLLTPPFIFYVDDKQQREDYHVEKRQHHHNRVPRAVQVVKVLLLLCIGVAPFGLEDARGRVADGGAADAIRGRSLPAAHLLLDYIAPQLFRKVDHC